jgi:hypothetical protein
VQRVIGLGQIGIRPPGVGPEPATKPCHDRARKRERQSNQESAQQRTYDPSRELGLEAATGEASRDTEPQP